MLRQETVEPGTLALIRRFSADPVLKDFALVGGTALALQLGHRKSIDIDLFTAKAFDPRAVAGHLGSEYRTNDIKTLGNAIFARVDGVKVDLLAHQYPWIKPALTDAGVRMASPEDIAAMKLHAIVNSGSRLKDFIDIHFLLEKSSLEQMLQAYSAKYPDSNPAIARNALLHHKDVDRRVSIDLMNRQLSWSEVTKRLEEAISRPNHVFEGLSRSIRRGLRR